MKCTLCLIILSGLILASCGTFTVTIERTPAGSVGSQATATSVLQPATPPAGPTETRLDSTKEPATTEPPTAEPTTGSQLVQIFLIAIDDNGKSGDLVGCGDSAVPVQVEVPATQGVLKAAMQALLDIKVRTYGESGLYNVFYQSDLQVDRVVIEGGTAKIELSGTMMLGGVCDNPRVEAQLIKTALQFSTVSEVAITINGKPLKDVLSLK